VRKWHPPSLGREGRVCVCARARALVCAMQFQRLGQAAPPAGSYKWRQDDYWYRHEGLMTIHWPDKYEANERKKNTPLSVNERLSMTRSMPDLRAQSYTGLRSTGPRQYGGGRSPWLPTVSKELPAYMPMRSPWAIAEGPQPGLLPVPENATRTDSAQDVALRNASRGSRGASRGSLPSRGTASRGTLPSRGGTASRGASRGLENTSLPAAVQAGPRPGSVQAARMFNDRRPSPAKNAKRSRNKDAGM